MPALLNDLPPRILVMCSDEYDGTAQPEPARLHGGEYFCATCGATTHEPYAESDRRAIADAARRGR